MTSRPQINDQADDALAPIGRRRFLMVGLGLFAFGCASTSKTSSLPGVIWPKDEPRPRQPIATKPTPPTTTAPPAAPASLEFSGVISRNRWSAGDPVPTLMDRLTGVRYITIHHDGMNPFFGDDSASAADRIELIRRSHRGKGWGDIGYHFVVDRGGRIWQGRPLGFQGAHVKDHNEQNIGIMALGNFDLQSPSDAQVVGLSRHVSAIVQRFGIPVGNVRTHQEWAATACPGRNMQHRIVTMRSRSFVA